MEFFAQKVLRKVAGNWTFVVVSIYDFQQSVGLNSETDWNESSEPFFTGTLDLGPARFRKCDEFGATGGADRPFLEGNRWRRRSSYLGSLAW